jgi:hypothetical protein
VVGHIAAVAPLAAPEPVMPAVAAADLDELTADTEAAPIRTATEPPKAIEARPAIPSPVRSAVRATRAATQVELASMPSTADDEPTEEVTAAPDIHVIDGNGDALAAQPETVLEEGSTRVRIPFAGSLQDMHALLWADPLALAIDLPHGSSTLAEGRYSIGAGGITDLRVNKRDDALLIRVKLSSPISRYTITAEDGTLEARLEQLAPSSP